MPPIIPDAPAWLNAIVVLGGIALTAAGAVWVAMVQTRRKVDAIDKQIVNSHADQPNLREDVDELKAMARSQAMTLDRLEGFIKDIAKTQRAQKHSQKRNDELIEKRLEEAIEDRETQVADLEARLDQLTVTITKENP